MPMRARVGEPIDALTYALEADQRDIPSVLPAITRRADLPATRGKQRSKGPDQNDKSFVVVCVAGVEALTFALGLAEEECAGCF